MSKIRNKKFFIVTSILLVTLFLSLLTNNKIYGTMEMDNEDVVFEITEYVYPITPNDESWCKLGSVGNKIEACRIDSYILKKMTDEALVQAILEYPFLCDLFLHSNYEEAVLQFEKNCDAYAELVSRDNGKNILINAIDNISLTLNEKVSAEVEIKNEALCILALFQSKYKKAFNDEEIAQVMQVTNLVSFEFAEENISERAATDTLYYSIKTPRGTLVGHYLYSCSHDSADYHSLIDQYTVNTYNVSLIRSGSCKYNCHSYAWFSQNSNPFWIPDPSAYMTDGSYSMIMSGLNYSSSSAKSGDIVFYGATNNLSTAHSAILVSGSTGAPLSSRMVYSKWGQAGVFSHVASNVPSVYNTSTVTVWKSED